MYSTKTKRGTPIRSTQGMKSPNHQRTWILVADRSRLCLFEKTGDLTRPSLELKQEYANPDGRKKGRELVADRPGRSFDSQDQSHHGQAGGTRHAYGSAVLPEDHAVENLIAHAVDLLGESSFQDHPSRVAVVAEPRLLGKLRPALERAAPGIEMTFHEKDFAWLKNAQLEERLSELVR